MTDPTDGDFIPTTTKRQLCSVKVTYAYQNDWCQLSRSHEWEKYKLKSQVQRHSIQKHLK